MQSAAADAAFAPCDRRTMSTITKTRPPSLRELRHARDLTQTTVSARTHIGLSHLRTLEAGALPVGPSEALDRLAAFYGVTVDELRAGSVSAP